VLDVVEGRVWQMTSADIKALGARALVLREKHPRERTAEWYTPFWTTVRPVIAKLAMTSLLINILGLATPLFMMVVLNRVIGRGAPQVVAALMTMLSAGLLAGYALAFSLRAARGRLSARAGARLDTLMSAESCTIWCSFLTAISERTPSGVIAERAAPTRRAARLLDRPDAGAKPSTSSSWCCSWAPPSPSASRSAS
jgi:ABC-type bacteriocin/lantibiotic exporter with double-glycine peptidase domain